MAHENQAMTEVDVAERLGLAVATLRAWRHRHTGPRFVRFGRAVRYLPADIDAFIAASRVDTATEMASSPLPAVKEVGAS